MLREEIRQVFLELKKLQNGMDIPQGRKDSVKWLLKNLEARNKNHPNYIQVVDLLEKLSRAGVHNSSGL